MAVNKNGALNGKVGKTVTYLLDGVQVTRSIGVNTKEPTTGQLGVRQRTQVINAFLKQIADFIGVGFEFRAKKANKKSYAMAFGYNWEFGLKGTYPNIEVDYEHLRVADGLMPMVEGVELGAEKDGLRYSWPSSANTSGMHWSDQVMMLAYFPDLNKAFHCTAGATRNVGTAVLPIHYDKKELVAETYLAFISNDRKKISNSIYTGQVIW